MFLFRSLRQKGLGELLRRAAIGIAVGAGLHVGPSYHNIYIERELNYSILRVYSLVPGRE